MVNDPREKSDETADTSFADILNEFESTSRVARQGGAKGKGKNKPSGPPPRRGTVVGVSGDFVLIDYGDKAEGVIPSADLLDADGNLGVKRGDSFDVAITGYNSEGMATLSRVTGPRPRDWEGLTRAFENKEIVAGRVTGAVKGGFTVDVGTRAFMPASRSGTRDAEEMEKLVGQEIRCRIIKLDVDEEDVVVDRRAVVEEEAHQVRQNTLATLEEGAVVRGTVRSLAGFGAFIDIGGIDGLLHVGDISWARVADPATELAVGDVLDLKVLKVDKQTGKISLGLKQMSPDPREEAVAKLNPGDRVTGEVTRLTDFGAFVEVLPGVEGLIHVSEMSWTKRIQRPGDVLKKGERVEAEVLKVDRAAGRLSLGLKQVLGNPWDTIKDRYPSGKVIEGKVIRLAKFGAFVEVEEGIDGMIHVSDFTNEKRIEHPSERVKVGQTVRAVVLSADPETKRLKLGLKQLEATSADQFAQEAAVGDRVSGRVIQVRGKKVTVQLGEGVEGVCIVEAAPDALAPVSGGSLAEQLAAAWKGGVKSPAGASSEPYREGQVRSFTIKAIDAAGKKIELAPA
ncbi:MAG TPA: 30S ribosomal protein S1 [Burkholderiales bacterium]|jgi:small subunit ribosomal protein S1|nr:30S ribosomal protein S1 [Burkholderiales bacterium]